MHTKTNTNFLISALAIFKQYQKMGTDAMQQLENADFYWKPEPESNSVYIIVKHMHGNMQSRWTDIFTTDGEKPTRNRDGEFEEDELTKEQILSLWNEGWQHIYNSLEPLTQADLDKHVFIRSEAHSLLEAINRQIAHYSYHVGQIVYLAKAIKSSNWQTLSIAKNKSKEYNQKMNHK